MSATKWNCPKCGLINQATAWTCFACYNPIPENQIVIPKTMKGLIKEKAGKGYAYKEDIEVPEPGEGELLIKSYSVGICGSDIILYNWTSEAETIAKIPFTPGHEAAGLVVKKGPNTNFKIGARVGIENHFFCGECYTCQHKRADICMKMSQFGHGKGTIYGGCSEYFIVKEIYCYRLRTSITWSEAALLEPLGVAHNACERLEPKNEDVLVIGCGTIGLLVIAVCKVMGCKNIIAIDVLDDKLALATKMGANIVINSNKENIKDRIMKETNNNGMGRIIECSGSADMLNKSFSLLRKGAFIVLVGLPKQPLHVDNVLQDIIFKSITLKTIHGRRIFHTWRECENLIASGKIKPNLVLSHHLPLSRWEEGYDALLSGKAIKVIFDPTK